MSIPLSMGDPLRYTSGCAVIVGYIHWVMLREAAIPYQIKGTHKAADTSDPFFSSILKRTIMKMIQKISAKYGGIVAISQ